MLTRPATCTGCPLHDEHIALGWMNPEGSGAIPLAVYAEALGEQEANEGLPLRPTAPAGSIFERTLRKAGINREQLVVSNVVKCRPGNRNLLEHQWYEFQAIGHCKQYMDLEFEIFKPKMVLALGGVALRTLTGYAGEKQSITHVRGFVLDNVRYPGVPVIATYHPAFIARDKQNLLGVLRLDILRAAQFAKDGKVPPRPAKHFIKFPNITEAENWLRIAKLHPELPIKIDIETTDSIGSDESELRVLADGAVERTRLTEEYFDAANEAQAAGIATGDAVASTEIIRGTRITQIQFSIRGTGDAIVVPWDNGPFTAFAKSVMALPNVKMGWNNWRFDDPILRSYGTVINGVNHDLMWAWHHLQPDLPRGVQYATSFFIPEAEPWKHKAELDLGDYGGCDVAYPRQFGPKLLEALKERGIWNGYERHVLNLNPILEAASARGIPMDKGRLTVLGGKLDDLAAGVDDELQSIFPDELRNCEPKEGYVSEKIAEKRMLEGRLERGERWAKRRFRVNPTVNVKRKGAAAKTNGHNSYGAAGAGVGNGDTGRRPEEAGGADQGGGGYVVAGQLSRGGGEVAVEVAVVGDGNSVEDGNSVKDSTERWCRVQPFLPNSYQQILKYIKYKREEDIQGRMGRYRAARQYAGMAEAALKSMAERTAIWKVPMKFREEKETTEKKELLRLGAKTGDKFFGLVVEFREYKKVKATYIGGEPGKGWWPGEDGRTHPTFGYGPATGQLSAHGPNSQNAPKPGGEETPAEARKTQLAKWFRECVCAPPGFKIMEFDKKSFHAQTLGFNARDPVYMKIAKLDIHSFVTANVLWTHHRGEMLAAGLPPNPESWMAKYAPEELGEFLGKIKKGWKPLRDKKIKPIILGIGLGLGDNKCFEMNKRDELNPRGFESIAEVRKLKVVLKGLFPSIFRYHDEIRGLAHRQGFLKSRYEYMRWFFDVYHNRYSQREGRWVEEAGNDSEAAIAFNVQNDAHGMLKEEMLRLERLGAMERFGFCNTIHDSLVFCCRDELVEEAVHTVLGVMREPSLILIDPVVAPGGLVCDAEVAVGEDWEHCEVVKNV